MNVSIARTANASASQVSVDADFLAVMPHVTCPNGVKKSFPPKFSWNEMEREKKRTAELSTDHKGSKTDIARRAQKQRSPKDESKRLPKVAATYSPTTQCSTIGDAGCVGAAALSARLCRAPLRPPCAPRLCGISGTRHTIARTPRD